VAESEDERLLRASYWQPARLAVRLGGNVSDFMKRVVEPRRIKLAALAEAWEMLLPQELAEHTCLEDIRSGRLRVLVDSGPHLSELNILLRAGFLDELRAACPSVRVSRVSLERGQWYRFNEEGIKVPIEKKR
jgi:hypothetical protein